MRNTSFAILSSFLLVLSQSMQALSQPAVERDDEFYLNYFQNYVFKQRDGSTEYVYRWQSNMNACLFGDYTERDSERLETFIHFLNEITNLNISTEREISIEQCNKNDTIFFRFHRGDEKAVNTISYDLSYLGDITGRYLYFQKENYQLNGMGLLSFGSTFQPYIYIALKADEPGKIQINASNSIEIIQKPLFGSLTAINKRTDRAIPTFLVDPLSTLPSDTTAPEKDRRINLCRFDVMTLLVLYGKDQRGVSTKMPLDYYLTLIRSNYQSLSDTAYGIVNDQKFSSIFVKKC